MENLNIKTLKECFGDLTNQSMAYLEWAKIKESDIATGRIKVLYCNYNNSSERKCESCTRIEFYDGDALAATIYRDGIARINHEGRNVTIAFDEDTNTLSVDTSNGDNLHYALSVDVDALGNITIQFESKSYKFPFQIKHGDEYGTAEDEMGKFIKALKDNDEDYFKSPYAGLLYLMLKDSRIVGKLAELMKDLKGSIQEAYDIRVAAAEEMRRRDITSYSFGADEKYFDRLRILNECRDKCIAEFGIGESTKD